MRVKTQIQLNSEFTIFYSNLYIGFFLFLEIFFYKKEKFLEKNKKLEKKMEKPLKLQNYEKKL